MIKKAILQALFQVEKNEPDLQDLLPVSGGDINQAFKAVTSKREYFIKLNTHVPDSFFRIEAEGLERIRQTNTVPVPEVYYFNQPKAGEAGILIQEWIEGISNSGTAYQFGKNLAKMHLLKQKQFGYQEDTYIGELSQPNGCYDNWLTYYREKRLLPQLKLAAEQNRLPGERGKKLDLLIQKLENWIDPAASASLLHGDLWGGNWLTGKNGQAYVIDPSVFYGDRLMDLAFTELFGGFSPAFYKGYQETAPLPAHYPEVKPLYQLFYLLVHLNLFGEGYGGSVDQVLRKYVS